MACVIDASIVGYSLLSWLMHTELHGGWRTGTRAFGTMPHGAGYPGNLLSAHVSETEALCAFVSLSLG